MTAERTPLSRQLKRAYLWHLAFLSPIPISWKVRYRAYPELGDREFSCGSIFIFSLMCSFTTAGPWMFSEWYSAVLVNQGLSEGSWGARPGFYLFCFFFLLLLLITLWKILHLSQGVPGLTVRWPQPAGGLGAQVWNRTPKTEKENNLEGSSWEVLRISFWTSVWLPATPSVLYFILKNIKMGPGGDGARL